MKIPALIRRSSLAPILFALLASLASIPAAGADENSEAAGYERTPPRLSLTDGQVSFWRSGATDWAPAQVNTPLAEGDELYTGSDSNLEIQIGERAYARAGEDTQLGLTNLEPDFLQLRVSQGTASLDVRSLTAGHTLEVDTPNAAFTIEHSGYYRVEVDPDTTHFSSRRGGHASVTTANGRSAAIAPSEQVVITGTDQPTLETYAAPDLDGWDRWNYERTDQLIDAVSSRYVPADVYGADDLDHYGDWRVVPTYGAVWFPHVAAGWVPYSTGNWIYDPYYGWSWVDDAPWGWAPFHHGRWVFVGSYWAWAPGPRVVHAYYSPALVAFYGTPGFSISIGIGHHPCGWVALGWGEPVVPWWGPAHWRGAPHWGGWGGPRVVNNVVINKTTVVDVTHINYVNAGRRDAVVAVDRRDFGRRDLREARLRDFDARKLHPVREADLGVKPSAASLVGTERTGRRPPQADLERAVVATRQPRRAEVPALDTRGRAAKRAQGPAGRVAGESMPAAAPPARVVSGERAKAKAVPDRPPFGQRGDGERAAPPRPPRYSDVRNRPSPQVSEPRVAPAPPQAVQENRGRRQPATAAEAPAPPRGRGGAERGRAAERTAEPPAPRELPGEPANRVFRGGGRRSEAPPQNAAPQAPAQNAPSAPPAGAGGHRGSGGGGGHARGHGQGNEHSEGKH